MIRPRLLCLLLGLLPILAAGCFNSEQSADENDVLPFAGQTIGIAVPQGLGLRDGWRLILEEWSAQTGADYEVVEYDALDSLGEADSQANLLVFPLTQMAELTAAGRLAAIPREERSSAAWMDVFLGLRENVASIDGRPAVLPVSSPVLVCYYRRDLLESAGLSPPETWEDYQKLIDTRDRWAPGLTVVEPWGEEFRTTMFLSRAVAFAKHPANYSLFFNIDTGRPAIDEPGFVAALNAAQQALAQMPPEVRDYTPADCRRELIEGRAALVIALETPPDSLAATAAPQPGSSTARPEAMQIGVRRLPGARLVYNRTTRQWEPSPHGPVNYANLTAFSGLCAGITAGSTPEQTKAAWNLLSMLTSEYLTAAFPPGTRSLCRKSQASTAMTLAGNDLTAGEKLQYVSAVAQSLEHTQVVAELPVVGRDEFRTALGDGLSRFLDDNGDPEEILSAVASRWNKIAAAVGPEQVKKSYQRSLGLFSIGSGD